MVPMDADNKTYPDSFLDAVAAAVDDGLRLDDLRSTLAAQTDRLVGGGLFRGISRLILTGSGDSLFAAQCVRPALQRWTGLIVEVRSALELARYEAPLLDPDRDLVIGVSNSGSSSRTRETVLLSRDRGVRTLGVTGSVNGPLASLSQEVLHRPVVPLEGLPAHWGRVFLNMAEYLAALHALYELGLALGVDRGVLTSEAAADLRREATEITARLAADAAAVEPIMAGWADEVAGLDALWAIGGGPSRGTANYVAAKFHEQVPLAGIAQDLEEWAHLEYFLTLEIGAASVVLIHAPPGAAFDRAAELTTGIAQAGGRALVVTETGATGFDATAALVGLSQAPELLTPLSYHLPGQLLALHVARSRGVPHIPLRRTDDYWLIRGGHVRNTMDGL